MPSQKVQKKKKTLSQHEIKMGSVYLIHLPGLHMNDSWCTLFQIVSKCSNLLWCDFPLELVS